MTFYGGALTYIATNGRMGDWADGRVGFVKRRLESPSAHSPTRPLAQGHAHSPKNPCPTYFPLMTRKSFIGITLLITAGAASAGIASAHFIWSLSGAAPRFYPPLLGDPVWHQLRTRLYQTPASLQLVAVDGMADVV